MLTVTVDGYADGVYATKHGIKGIWYHVWYLVLGLSKVFLRHIAPERARGDQNLTAGPHFSAGHAQWRYALAT